MKQTEHPDLTENQRALLSYLRSPLCVHDGLMTWITVADLTLAPFLNPNPDRLARTLRELVKLGLVESRRKPYLGTSAPLQYRAKVEAGGKANG